MIAKYGIKSKEVSDWLSAQDLVFSEYKDKAKDKKTLEQLPKEEPEFAQNERNYQIAAYYFYNQKWDQAIDAFSLIEKNKKSRWRNIAPYLVARAYIRKAQLQEKSDRKAMFSNAKQQLQSILANKDNSSIHKSSKNLLQYISIRLEPDRTLDVLGDRIASGKSPSSFLNDLTDITKLFDDIEIQQEDEDESKMKPKPPVFQSDLGEWVWLFNSNKKDSF